MRGIIAAAAALMLAACSTAEPSEPAGPGPGQTGGICGGIAAFQCGDAADFCAMQKGVCGKVADASGVCKKKPEICTMDYNPVCGCDGETYSNACMAAASGVSIASDGECVEGS